MRRGGFPELPLSWFDPPDEIYEEEDDEQDTTIQDETTEEDTDEHSA
jgi:hypothetical protein